MTVPATTGQSSSVIRSEFRHRLQNLADERHAWIVVDCGTTAPLSLKKGFPYEQY